MLILLFKWFYCYEIKNPHYIDADSNHTAVNP